MEYTSRNTNRLKQMKKNRTIKDKSAAIITIIDAPKMSKNGRKDIADWMRRTATFLEKHAAELSPRFRARYIYNEQTDRK